MKWSLLKQSMGIHIMKKAYSHFRIRDAMQHCIIFPTGKVDVPLSLFKVDVKSYKPTDIQTHLPLPHTIGKPNYDNIADILCHINDWDVPMDELRFIQFQKAGVSLLRICKVGNHTSDKMAVVELSEYAKVISQWDEINAMMAGYGIACTMILGSILLYVSF